MFNFIFKKKSNSVNKRKTNKLKTKKNLSRFRNDGPNAFNAPYEEKSPKGDFVQTRNFDSELEVMWSEDVHSNGAIKSHLHEDLDDGVGSVLQVIDESNERKVTGFWSRWKSLRRKKTASEKNQTKTAAQVGKYRKSSLCTSNKKSSKASSKTFLHPGIENSTETLATPLQLGTTPLESQKDFNQLKLNYRIIKVTKNPCTNSNTDVVSQSKVVSNTVTSFTYGCVAYHRLLPFTQKLFFGFKETQIKFEMVLKLMIYGLSKKINTRIYNFSSEFEMFREAVERDRRYPNDDQHLTKRSNFIYRNEIFSPC